MEYSFEITKSNSIDDYGVFVTPSYKVGNNTSVGIGTGVKLFDFLEFVKDVPGIEYRYKRITSVPIYINTIYKLKKNKTTPFVECKLGYSFMNRDYSWTSSRLFPEEGDVELQNNLKGGPFVSPSIGFLFSRRNKQYISASLAYRLDRFYNKTYFVQLNEIGKGSNDYHSIAVRIGYVF